MEIKVYNNASREENKIALTFDDGPNPFWTEKVIAIFDEYGVKANFFVLGKWAEKYGAIVKETFKKGHLVGNHGYAHPREGEGDFEEAEKIIFGILGEHTKFIRPPYNNIGLCANYRPALEGEVKVINNDVVPRDWHESADVISNVAINETKNGSIILLHDGSQRETDRENRPTEMFKALPKIIEDLKKRFNIVRLDEMKF